MNRMIGDLMDMVSLRSGSLSINTKPTVINDVLREAVTTHDSRARHGLQLTTTPARRHARRGGSHAAHATVPEPAGNAVKFTKAGDTINITSRTRGNQARSRSPTAVRESRPTICRTSSILTTRQQKAPENRHGSACTRQGIVDAHGGIIRCTPNWRGHHVHITLPLTSAA